MEVVVVNEGDPSAKSGIEGMADDALQVLFPTFICRVRLAGDHDSLYLASYKWDGEPCAIAVDQIG